MYGLGLISGVIALIVAITALNRVSSLDRRIRELNLKLGKALSDLEGPRISVPAVAVEPIRVEKIEVTEPAAEMAAVAPAPPTSDAWNSKRAPIARPARAARSSSADVERNLASRWFAWLGGVAIAIAGVLFIKYAHDNGLFPPALRVAMGLIAGVALVAGAEYLRRKPLAAVADKTYVPAALSAAGLLIGFGSVFAGYGLYDLFGPATAFMLMAAIAIAGIVLSLAQGPLIGALGLIGAYAVPALVHAGDPKAWTFFPYLAIVMAAALAVLRFRTWWWLGYLALAGAFGWMMLWLNSGAFGMADILPIGLFAMVLAGLSLFAISGRGILSPGSGSLRAPETIVQPLWIGLAGTGAMMAGLAALTVETGHAPLALALLMTGAAAVVALSVLKPGVDLLAPATALGVLATLAVWREAAFFQMAMDERGLWVSVAGPDQLRYLTWTLSAGLGFAATGFVMLQRAAQPNIWAALAAGAIVLFGFFAWARVPETLLDLTWALGGAAATAALLGQFWLLRNRPGDIALAMGFLAGGAALTALFGFDRMFDRVWLTLAIALIPPAYGLIARRVANPYLGPIAVAVAALVAIRLFVSHDLWSNAGGLPLGDHWVLYGYGVPAVLFWLASRWFGATGAVRTQMSLEGGAIALAISLVSLELRVLIGGGITADAPGLLEIAAHAMAWLGAAYGLAYRQTLFSSAISRWAGRLLTVAAVAMIIGGSLLILNPVVTEERVAGSALFNTLLLAYLAPAVLLTLLAQKLSGFGWAKLRPAFGMLALVLVLAFITLEIKRIYQGPYLVAWPLSAAEDYSTSAAWLVTALTLFVAGLRFARAYLRYAGLAVMVLVSLKVFLWDLSGLGGLYQIASFLGLGLCLVGIAYLYTRFMQVPQKATP